MDEASAMGKTLPKEEDADGNTRKKAPRVEPVDDAALTTDAVASAPSPTGNTPPKGEEAEKSPRKTASRLDDADLATAPGASASSPTRKTPRKEEAEGSPPRKSPRRQDRRPAAAVPLPTVPESSELIVKGAGRASDEKQCKCNHVITESAMEELSAIEESSPSLKSKDAWTCYGCWCDDKARIVKTRPEKSDHLICMTCCLHLCCGVGSIAYPFGHSRAHALRNKHWFAVLYCDPERGYCFKCNAEVPMPAKFGEGGNEVNLQQTHDIVSRKLLAPSPSVGALSTAWEKEASDEKRCNCNHATIDSAIKKMESSVWFNGAWTCSECRDEKSDLFICVTCCDHPCCGAGPIAYPFGHSRAHALKKQHWFAVLYCDSERGFCFKCNIEVPTAVSRKLLAPPPCIGRSSGQSSGRQSRSSDAQGYAIRGIPNRGNTCYMSAVLQCLLVLGKLRERMLVLDRPKGPLAEVLKKLFVEASVAGDELNPEEVLECVHKHSEPRFKVGAMEDSHELLTVLREILKEGDAPTVIDSIFGIEMLQTLSCKKCGPSLTPRLELDLKLDFPSKWHSTTSAIGSEVIVEKTHKLLESDSSQVQRISQSKDVVQSPSLIQEGKCVDSLAEDSIEKLLLLFFGDTKVAWRCTNCTKDHEPSFQSKNDEQIVGSGNEDDVGDTVKILRLITLPPVLTLHLNRTSDHKGTYMVENIVDNTVGIKISGHVRFEEYLDVEQFMVPSSDDEGSTRYRLAGVVQHIGKGLNAGHYIAYVRARRLGNQQEGSSCSSSWFCANDEEIKKVSIEEVLDIEAYILFYERVEEQEPEDIFSHWELIGSDEAADLEDYCSVHEEDFGNFLWLNHLLHSKYTNRERVERLQTIFEWVGQFSNLADIILPAPVSSVVVKASSQIGQVNMTVAAISQALQVLQSVIPPPDRLVVLSVANKEQARHAVSLWNESSRPHWYCVKIVDQDQIHEVKEVLDQWDAGRLLWRYHPELCVTSI